MREFFNKMSEAIRSEVVRWCERIRTNVPLRMSIGKFGIKLMKIGRFLQIRYANWNHEFRLKMEFHPNPDRSTLHVSEQVTNESILTFGGCSHNEKKQTPLSRELLAMRGVTEVVFQPYHISIGKARVYEWEEILPAIQETIFRHLTKAA